MNQLEVSCSIWENSTEALKLLQEVYGDDTMSRTWGFEWHKKFQEGREDVEVDSKSGRPSTCRTSENIQPVAEKVRHDRRLTVLMITEEYRTLIMKEWEDHHRRFGNESWLLHHNNAPAHRALSIRELLDKNNIAMLEQPLYSPDLDPVTFSLLHI